MESLLFSTSTTYFAMHGFLTSVSTSLEHHTFSVWPLKKSLFNYDVCTHTGEYEINRLQNAGNNENEIIFDS